MNVLKPRSVFAAEKDAPPLVLVTVAPPLYWLLLLRGAA
jgi:hypothetical protein